MRRISETTVTRLTQLAASDIRRGGWIFHPLLCKQTDAAAMRFASAMREASILTLQGVKLDKNFTV